MAAGRRSSTGSADGAGLAGHRLTIGAAARRSGFSVRTLRFYERSGLLPPVTRTPSGYRIYIDADLHRLDFIREAKVLGLPLRDIRELITAQTGSCRATRPLLLALLDDRIAQSEQQVQALIRLKAKLQRQRRALLIRSPSDHRLGYCSCLKFAPRSKA